MSVVLLIEDNADAREALRVLLELDGYDVEVAGDGAQGIEIARAKTPAVALVDIGLPGIDGFEVARRLRELPGPPSYLVALTGYSDPDDRRRAGEAGFDAHVVKPVDPDELTRLLARLGVPGPGSP
jgi:CheY-like chemotaxis protein